MTITEIVYQKRSVINLRLQRQKGDSQVLAGSFAFIEQPLYLAQRDCARVLRVLKFYTFLCHSLASGLFGDYCLSTMKLLLRNWGRLILEDQWQIIFCSSCSKEGYCFSSDESANRQSLASSRTLLPLDLYGSLPVKRQWASTPSAKTSHEGEGTQSLLKDYGAAYPGVPQLLQIACPSSKDTEKPKSMILTSPFLKLQITFSGLMSR